MIDGDFVTINDPQDGSGPTPDRDGVLPECTPEAFEKKKAGWKSAIEAGHQTVNDLITTIETKELLSNDQKVEIAGWAVKGA